MDQRTLFLRQVKLFVEKHGFILVPREQNISFMAEHGMTVDDLRRVILSLERRTCSMGRSRTGDPRRAEKWTVGGILAGV